MTDEITNDTPAAPSFFEQPGVELSTLSAGVRLGVAAVRNEALGFGGAYGAWGEPLNNAALPGWIEQRVGLPLAKEDSMELGNLGFTGRHHLGELTPAEHLQVELEVGTQLLQQALRANDWQPQDVGGVLIGMSGPVADDYVEQIARRAGIPERALKVSVHKACDSSVGALHQVLNPALGRKGMNLAEELKGKKLLVGGIEGLSRFTGGSRDLNALQLFGNGAGVIGVVPGETMKFLVGSEHENFDQDGVLAVRMYYPHSRQKDAAGSLVELRQESANHLRLAGMMHEPDNGASIEMAGPMGMVKLFVRTGVEVVSEIYRAYTALMQRLGTPERLPEVGIVHHANYKINQLKRKHLEKLGISFPMPWLLSEFGNVSAASNMITFLRQLPQMRPGQHILIDGFGAGTYYDVLAVELG